MSASSEPRGAKAKSKAKATAQVTRIDPALRHDYDWTVGPDPRDPRTDGPPCERNHHPMRVGRGSMSGRNGHAEWVVCEKCRLRLSYTPAIGAHARFRQAGPLPAAVTTVMNKGVSQAEELDTTQVALAGAEESLEKRLVQIREARAKVAPANRASPAVRTSTTTTPKAPSRAQASDSPSTEESGYSVVEPPEAADSENLGTTPPRKGRRGADDTAEDLEYTSRGR